MHDTQVRNYGWVLSRADEFNCRGRYDVDMFADFMRLRGKTYDYKIMYSSIVKLFLLPRTDEIHVQFVINLDPPIRQGQTRYPYLIMQFAKEEEMDAEIQLDEATLRERYAGKLDKKYEAPAFEVVSTVFKALSGKKITTPGNFQRCVPAGPRNVAEADSLAVMVDIPQSKQIMAQAKATCSSLTRLCCSSARLRFICRIPISAKCGASAYPVH